MNKKLKEFEDKLRSQGLEPGSKNYTYALKKLKVEECQSYRGVFDCRACGYFIHCELAKSLLREEHHVQYQNLLGQKKTVTAQTATLDRFIAREGIEVHSTVGSDASSHPRSTCEEDSVPPSPAGDKKR